MIRFILLLQILRRLDFYWLCSILVCLIFICLIFLGDFGLFLGWLSWGWSLGWGLVLIFLFDWLVFGMVWFGVGLLKLIK